MKRISYPTISVVMATYNSERTIERALQSIRSQHYIQKKIEIIIADGGSTDSTKDIASKYSVIWISVPVIKQNAEYNKSIALQKAKNEIIAFIDHDNILTHIDWLREMTLPFIYHSDIVGVETLRYHFDPKSSLLDRYFALFGAGDPLVWYLGKSDRLSYIFDQYNLAGTSRDCGLYYLVKFSLNNIPTIGANGFLIRKDLIKNHAMSAPGNYFDMDINVDLIKAGYSLYAFVKTSILHLTGYGNIKHFFIRRMLYLDNYRFGEKGRRFIKNRRYGTFNLYDRYRLLVAVLICVSIVIPLYDSIRGWKKIHNNAWFLHPLICLLFVIMYSWTIIKYIFNKTYKLF